MRDRLIELINDMQEKGINYAKNEDEISCHVSNKNVADYLLENGVIVPPCKVGDVIYDIRSGKVFGGKIIMINVLDGYFTFAATGGRYFCDDDIGKSVFLTKEEAEQALKGGEG